MKTQKHFLLFCIFITVFTIVSAQKNKISIGTQIPLNYSIAYEENIHGGFYVNYHFGYLTAPYVKVLFDEAEKRGLDPSFSVLLEDYFYSGISHQGQIKYAPNFMKGFYLGGSFKMKNVRAVQVPYQLIADNFGVDLTPYEDNVIFQSLVNDIDFNVDLTIPGLFIGKVFQLGKSNWSIYLEASYHRVVSSTSLVSFSGSNRTVTLLNEPVNEEINKALNEDSNLYSLNVGISYTLPVSINMAITSLFKKKVDKE